jgi:hypothetical protein
VTEIKPGQLWRNLKKGTIYEIWAILPDTDGNQFVIYDERPGSRFRVIRHTEIEGKLGIVEDGVIKWLAASYKLPSDAVTPWVRPIEMWHSKFEYVAGGDADAESMGD